MRETIFNVIANEPHQLVHCDMRVPERAFLIFAFFYGVKKDDKFFDLQDINFYLEEVNLKVKQPGTRKFHQILNNSFEYDPKYHSSTGEILKQVKFSFVKTDSIEPIFTCYHKKDEDPPILVRKYEKIDIKAKMTGFGNNIELPYNEPIIGVGENRNINSHICNIRFFFE